MASPAPSAAAEQPVGISSLPQELLEEIFSGFSNSELKQLRLTATIFRDAARPRITRVFLSPNIRDIEVLRAVAGDEKYRHQVKEIIWDDTRFIRSGPEDDDANPRGNRSTRHAGCPPWFSDEYNENNNTVWKRSFDGLGKDFDNLYTGSDDKMSAAFCWIHYDDLLSQQDIVLQTNADIHAFRHAVRSFPSLKRVTVTPAVHAIPFLPLYRTPLIRTFMYGFNYPLPRGWLTGARTCDHADLPQWGDDEDDKQYWRGFRAACRVLAEESCHDVRELLFPSYHLNTGINSRIFDQPCQEYDDLVTLIQRPGFRHFDISLAVKGINPTQWKFCRSERLRNALANATDLEDFSLTVHLGATGVLKHPRPIENRVPLREVLPITQWQKLKHFSLRGFVVALEDLISLLSELPRTVKTVDLSYILFHTQHGNYQTLLESIKNDLDWRQRPISSRPTLRIVVDMAVPMVGRGICISAEANDFVYGDGKNPFTYDPGLVKYPNIPGCGGMVQDEFHPSLMVPYHPLRVLHFPSWDPRPLEGYQ